MENQSKQTEKVWFVTGASKGLGAELVQQLLSEGYKVAATSRNTAALEKAIGQHENLFPLEMDLSSNDDVKKAIGQVVEKFGRIDVVVNNAGFSQIGAIEELSASEVQQNFEINVFGPLHVIRNAAPYLREQRSGHIFNISSIGGYVGNYAAFGIYCATKFAVAGYTEALAVEMEPFGVHTTLVYPGYFRTNFLAKDSAMVPDKVIEDYANAREEEAKHLNEISGNQPNDPKKAAAAFIELSKQSQPPIHFFMGVDTASLVKGKIEIIEKALAANLELTESTGIVD